MLGISLSVQPGLHKQVQASWFLQNAPKDGLRKGDKYCIVLFLS